MTCSCSQTQPRGDEPLLQTFGEVRETCPALSKVLLPPDAWQALVAAECRPPDAARHASSVLLAFEQGHLARITAPVHRFLLDGAELRPNLTAQYRKDLQERWLLAQNEAARHERFQKFFGKIAELLLAQWLVEQTWTVRGLEALGGDTDIIAESPAQGNCAFEVKYIGWQTHDFLRVVEALAGGNGDGGAVPVLRGVPCYFFTAANYFLFRVYEAARQLRQREGARIAAVIIDAMSWRRFAKPLDEQWIAWNEAQFLDASDDWTEFLHNQRDRYPELATELTPVISSLNHLWVFRLTDYNCVLAHQVSFTPST